MAHKVKKVDTIVLLIEGTTSQWFTSNMVSSIRRLTSTFGQQWWDHLVIGVSFWSYSEEAMAGRECSPNSPNDCEDEAWVIQEVNNQMQEKFGVTKNIPVVFVDSKSQIPDNIGDKVQQHHWEEETGKLWNITINRQESFFFKTVDDLLEEKTKLLEENSEQRKEIERLNLVVDNKISQLTKNIEMLNNAQVSVSKQIHENKYTIKQNKQAIDENNQIIKKTLNAIDRHSKDNARDIQLLNSTVITQGDSIRYNAEDIEANHKDIRNNKDIADKGIKENEENIIQNRNQTQQNSFSIEENKISTNNNTNTIDNNRNSIDNNRNSIDDTRISAENNKISIEDNRDILDRLSIRGAQCGYRRDWTTAGSTITYEKTLLNVGRGSMDLGSGVWTAQEKGLYQVAWGFHNRVNSG